MKIFLKRKTALTAVLKCLAVSLLLTAIGACKKEIPGANLRHIGGETMGTHFIIKYHLPKGETTVISEDSLKVEVHQVLARVNRQMSTYIPDSELSLFNASDDTAWFPISDDLRYVLEASLDICRKSDGAFDITVGPLVNLWGFGPKTRSEKVPTDQQIAEKHRLVDYRRIEVRRSPPAVRKLQTDIYCDLSASAKGFGVDKVARHLQQRGIKNFMVEIGGEVRTYGISDRGGPWRIGIATPDGRFGIQKVVTLNDRSMATSGDYLNYFEKDGKRYSHTIDPKTGRPITHTLTSVSVVHPSCMMADGIATAISVLGAEKGMELAKKYELPIYIVVRANRDFQEMMTEEFAAILSRAE